MRQSIDAFRALARAAAIVALVCLSSSSFGADATGTMSWQKVQASDAYQNGSSVVQRVLEDTYANGNSSAPLPATLSRANAIEMQVYAEAREMVDYSKSSAAFQAAFENLLGAGAVVRVGSVYHFSKKSAEILAATAHRFDSQPTPAASVTSDAELSASIADNGSGVSVVEFSGAPFPAASPASGGAVNPRAQSQSRAEDAVRTFQSTTVSSISQTSLKLREEVSALPVSAKNAKLVELSAKAGDLANQWSDSVARWKEAITQVGLSVQTGASAADVASLQVRANDAASSASNLLSSLMVAHQAAAELAAQNHVSFSGEFSAQVQSIKAAQVSAASVAKLVSSSFQGKQQPEPAKPSGP